MIRKIGLLVLILHLAVVAMGQESRAMGGSKSGVKESGSQVLEKSARATLEQDGLTGDASVECGCRLRRPGYGMAGSAERRAGRREIGRDTAGGAHGDIHA